MKHTIKAVAFSLGLVTLSANAATVTVVGSPAPAGLSRTPTGDVLGTVGDHAVVGFFKNFLDTPTFRLLLSQPDKDIMSQYIKDNFVPLGYPSDPAVQGSTSFGAASTVQVNTLTTGETSVSGGVTGASLVFNSGTPNTFTAGGLNRGTRMFLLVYDDPNADAAGYLGIFSAAEWVVPTTTSTIMSMPLVNLDNDNEVFRGARGSLILSPLVSIPEPATGLLGLLAVGLLARRRR